MTTVKDILGSEIDDFSDFDLTEIQDVLKSLGQEDPLDIVHAEIIQQKTLRAADLLSQYLSRIVKTVSLLESKSSTMKNKVALEYKDPDGGKTTSDMKKWAADSSQEVEAIQVSLAYAKGTKALLEKKYDVVIKFHHHAKDIAQGLRKTVVGYHPTVTSGDGW